MQSKKSGTQLALRSPPSTAIAVPSVSSQRQYGTSRSAWEEAMNKSEWMSTVRCKQVRVCHASPDTLLSLRYSGDVDSDLGVITQKHNQRMVRVVRRLHQLEGTEAVAAERPIEQAERRRQTLKPGVVFGTQNATRAELDAYVASMHAPFRRQPIVGKAKVFDHLQRDMDDRWGDDMLNRRVPLPVLLAMYQKDRKMQRELKQRVDEVAMERIQRLRQASVNYAQVNRKSVIMFSAEDSSALRERRASQSRTHLERVRQRAHSVAELPRNQRLMSPSHIATRSGADSSTERPPLV